MFLCKLNSRNIVSSVILAALVWLSIGADQQVDVLPAGGNNGIATTSGSLFVAGAASGYSRLFAFDPDGKYCHQRAFRLGGADVYDIAGGTADLPIVRITGMELNATFQLAVVPVTQPVTLFEQPRGILVTDAGPARFYSPSVGCIASSVTLQFTADGGKTWSQPQNAFAPDAPDWGINSERSISDSELIAAGDRGTLSRLSIKNGQATIVWSVHLPSPATDVALMGEKYLAVFAKGLLAVDLSNGKVVATVAQDQLRGYFHVEASASCAYVFGVTGLSTFAWKDGAFGPADRLTGDWVYAVAANHDPVFAIGSALDGKGVGLLAIQGRDLVRQTFVLEDDNLPTPQDYKKLNSISLQAGTDLSQKIWDQAQARVDLTPRRQVQWATEETKIHLAHGEGLVPILPTTVPDDGPRPPTLASSIGEMVYSFTATDGSVYLSDFNHVFAFGPDAKLCHQTAINLDCREKSLAGGSLDRPIVLGRNDSDGLLRLESFTTSNQPRTLLEQKPLSSQLATAAFFSASIGCLANGSQVSVTADGGKSWTDNPSIFPAGAPDTRVSSVAWISESDLVAGGDKGTLCDLKIDNGYAKVHWSTSVGRSVWDVTVLDDKHLLALSDNLVAVDRSSGEIVATTKRLGRTDHVQANKSCAYAFGRVGGLVAYPWDSGQFGPPKQLSESKVDAVFAGQDPLIAIGTGESGPGEMLVEKDGAMVEQKFLLDDDGDAGGEDFAAESEWSRKLRVNVGQQILELARDQAGMTRHQQSVWAIELMKQQFAAATQPSTAPSAR
jgi:hypothetical protein